MPAKPTAVNWNNQWWSEVVHKEKTALEPTVNTKSGTRYKTAPEVELKATRKALVQIRAAVLKWQNELFDRHKGTEADEINQRYAAAIVRAIDNVS